MVARNMVPKMASAILCLLALMLNSNFHFAAAITIGEPTFNWDGFRLNIDYQISQSIVSEKVTYDVVSDKDCEGGIIDDEEITTQLVELSENSVRVTLLMNPESIHAARYVTHHDDYAIIGVCSRLWINKPDDTFEPISATRDDYILIRAELERLEGVIEVLEDKAKRWGVDVYRCNDNRGRINNPPVIRNGEKLRLCIKPTQRTIDDGVHLGSIKTFHFERDSVIQDAVTTYGTDDVTNVFECERGSDICIVETVLDNDFFFSSGEVKGEGVFFLQWGKDPVPEERMLRAVKATIHDRSLYEWFTPGEIISEKIGLTTVAIQPMDKVYSAEAFACGNDNLPNKKSTLNETEHFHLCIRPNKEARDAGVYMNTIESFSFSLAKDDDRVQEVIDSNGGIVQENRTSVICEVGASVCTINSTLNDWFFDESETMVASGFAVLQFGQDRRRVQVNLDNLAFAGRDKVETFIDTVARNPKDDDKSPTRKWFDDIFDRYDLSESHLNALYITGIILIVLITLCCCGGCIFFFVFRGGSRTKEVADNKHTSIDIKINQQGKEVSQFEDENADAQPDYGYGYAPPMSPRSPHPRRYSNSDAPRSVHSRRGSNSNRSPYHPQSVHSRSRSRDGSSHPRSAHSRSRSRDGSRTPSTRTPKSVSSRRRGSRDGAAMSNAIAAPPLASPKPRRRNSNGDDGAMMSPKPRRRNSNGDDGSMRSPKPRRRNSNGDDGVMRSPKPRRRNSNGDDGVMKSPKPRKDYTKSPKPGKSPKPRRRNSNGDDGAMMSPKPRKDYSKSPKPGKSPRPGKSPKPGRSPRPGRRNSNDAGKSPRPRSRDSHDEVPQSAKRSGKRKSPGNNGKSPRPRRGSKDLTDAIPQLPM